MSEKMEHRLAVLEAFAQSKPTEFDAFVLRWEHANVKATPKLEEEPKNFALAKPSAELSETKIVEEEKPVKARRKKLGES